MLVLQRFENEQICIGDGDDLVMITVVQIRNGDRVRIGVEAPPHISVDRLEVRERKAIAERQRIKDEEEDW